MLTRNGWNGSSKKERAYPKRLNKQRREAAKQAKHSYAIITYSQEEIAAINAKRMAG